MNEREQLIEKLVTTEHLNVPERAALSPRTVRYFEVAAVVQRVLDATGYFPPSARAWQVGILVYEPAVLQKLSAGAYRLTLQRPQAIAPTGLAEKRELEFQNAAAAIEAFIAVRWPRGDIDGIIIQS
jgi:hypothetical protein